MDKKLKLVLAVCGLSGSGKTTLIESAVPRLLETGYSVGVIKHDAHGLDIDKPGKDSDRFFKTGADIAVHGPGEFIYRKHTSNNDNVLQLLIELMQNDKDIILVEGHKGTNLPKIWLDHPVKQTFPESLNSVITSLPFNDQRLERFLTEIRRLLEAGE